MSNALVDSPRVQKLLDRVSGLDQPQGDARMKQILRRVIGDLYATIDDFEVTPEEFWSALAFFQNGSREFGLMAPGLGFDHFLDIRMDRDDAAAGRTLGTPRTIEGPLYVPGAPLSKGFARIDDGTDEGDTLIMHGTVRDAKGKPVAGAVVDVWQCNTKGGYSHFDPSQALYNNRRRIEVDAHGNYKFRGIVPAGYGVPPGGATQQLLAGVGRHGRRPAHIHFFVSAPGFRHLTTQINIAGDPYLHDDFAYATREELIPTIRQRTDAASVQREGLNHPFQEIEFDFALQPALKSEEADLSVRPRAAAPG